MERCGCVCLISDPVGCCPLPLARSLHNHLVHRLIHVPFYTMDFQSLMAQASAVAKAQDAVLAEKARQRRKEEDERRRKEEKQQRAREEQQRMLSSIREQNERRQQRMLQEKQRQRQIERQKTTTSNAKASTKKKASTSATTGNGASLLPLRPTAKKVYPLCVIVSSKVFNMLIYMCILFRMHNCPLMN